MNLPKRMIGKTGFAATLFGLGGEGILRTTGKHREASAVIEKALELGVNYFDTAPAYEQSRDYLGSVFKNLGSKRKEIFVASKTHARDKKGSLILLEDTLRRLNVDYLDLWQLHDLREQADLDAIFSKNGAIEALQEARKEKLVRFFGITGHHDPDILTQAIERYDFDVLLVCVNPGDSHHRPFISTAMPKARKKNMGIIAMKVLAKSYLLKPRGCHNAQQAIHYALSQDVDLAIIGCDNASQVEENAAIAACFKKFSKEELAQMETLAKNNPNAWWFKKS